MQRIERQTPDTAKPPISEGEGGSGVTPMVPLDAILEFLDEEDRRLAAEAGKLTADEPGLLDPVKVVEHGVGLAHIAGQRRQIGRAKDRLQGRVDAALPLQHDDLTGVSP